MEITAITLIVAAVLFVHGKIRSDLVALLALVPLIIFNILTPREAFSGFSEPVIIMMVGLFVVGGGILQTGLANMISKRLLRFAGNSETMLFLLVMLITSFIGAFVSNTGTVALMMPVVVSMAVSAKQNPSRYLMPLAFASSMGGMMTLIGTPPNLVIQEELIKAGYPALSFFSFTPIGIISVGVGIVVLLPLSKLFLSKRGADSSKKGSKQKSQTELANEYQLSHNLYRIKAVQGSTLINKSLQELELTKKYNLSVLGVKQQPLQHRKKKSANPAMVTADTKISENEMLYVMGTLESARLMANEEHAELVGASYNESANVKLSFQEFGIAEVVLMPNSKLVNCMVKESGFREHFNVNILGIQRRGEHLLNDVINEKMRAGDVLLVQGLWNDISRLKNEHADWVVVGEPQEEAAKIPQTHKAPIAAGILLAMVATMTFEPIPNVLTIMLAALLMIFTGCLRNVEEAYKTINWQSVVLIGGMLPMSIALEKTGASVLISTGLVDSFGKYGPLALLAGVYLATSILTLFISNTATAVLLAPIAMSAAAAIGVSPYPFMFAVTVAASMCFASPFSTPPNALVMSAGHYKFTDYLKVGLPLQIILGIIMVLVLPLIFPF